MSSIFQLEDALKQKFGNVRRASKGFLRIACPTCDQRDSKKMKRYVPTTGTTSHCFICKVKIPVYELVGDHVMLTSKPRHHADEPEVVDPRSLTLPGTGFIPVNELDDNHPAIKFLHKDHLFNLDYYAAQGVCYCPVECGIPLQNVPFITSAERLIFPVYFNEHLVGWQARSLPGTFYGDRAEVIKYYHIFNKGKYLYNYDSAKSQKPVVIVEGVKKALKFGEWGIATFGTGISNDQVALMAATWSQFIIMLDAEEHNRTQTVARELRDRLIGMNKDAINVDLSHYGVVSPDDLPADELLTIANNEWEQRDDR